jgi:hypothetical protein
VSVNKPFKGFVQKFYMEWMAARGHDQTPVGKIKRPSLELLCDWILRAWNMISPEIIVKSFSKQASLMSWMGAKMTLFGLMVSLTMYTRKAFWRLKVETVNRQFLLSHTHLHIFFF